MDLKLLVEIPEKEEEGGWSADDLATLGGLLGSSTTPITATLVINVGATEEKLCAMISSIEEAPE